MFPAWSHTEQITETELLGVSQWSWWLLSAVTERGELFSSEAWEKSILGAMLQLGPENGYQ